MATTAAIAILVMLGIAIAFGLVLVVLVRREGPKVSGLDRESAERIARRDTDDGDDREW